MHQNQKTPFVKTVEATLEKHLSYDDFHVAELAEALYVSRTQLFRKLKQLTGHSPTTFIRYYRLKKGNHLLKNTQLPIKSISYQIGFKDPAHFTNAFKGLYGISPKEARR